MDRKEIALQRWKILRQALSGWRSAETCNSDVSVRRFSSFGLLQTQMLSITEDNEIWYRYTCEEWPDFHMTVRHLPGTIDAKTLLGFNNTGNVCVWPSEEVMAFYCMQEMEQFKNCSVCELGGGMTCLAGLALAVKSDVSSVTVSDGNEESVRNLECMLEHEDNYKQFGDTKISSRLIRWGEDEDNNDLTRKFDFVLCADCLFFDEGRIGLAELIYDILKPKGKAIMFAPHRGNTFQDFRDLAQKYFSVEVESNYNNKIWDLHCKMKALKDNLYDENIHFPVMMTLTKKS